MDSKSNCQRVAILLCVLSVLALPKPVVAQLTDNQRAGAYIGGPNPLNPLAPTAAESQQQRIQLAGGNALRKVGDKIYNIQQSVLWQIIDAQMYSYQKEDNVAILERRSLHFSGEIWYDYLAITNYSGSETEGNKVRTLAMRIGNYDMGGRPIELYDCGTPYVPPPPTPEQIAARKQAETEAQAKAAEQKKKADGVALKSNQDAAAKGDAYGLMRMGERYRDGDGVEKDLAKANEYLQKAADAGSTTAAEELSRLKQ
jgi:hypothetical protein